MIRLIIVLVSFVLLGYVAINVKTFKSSVDNHEADPYHALSPSQALQGVFGSLRNGSGATSAGTPGTTSGTQNQGGGYSVRKNRGEYLRTPADNYQQKSTDETARDFYPDQVQHDLSGKVRLKGNQ